MKNNEPSRWSYIHLDGEHRSSACKIYYVDRSGGYLPYRVQTTLWREMQRSVERILLENRIKRGTVIVLNAHNADVLAMASAPRWGIRAETWRQGELELLPPGSVFKLVSWFTYAKQTPRSKWLLQRTNCVGHYQRVNGVRCWNEAGHGIVNGIEALAYSCNIWFAAQQHLFSLTELERTGKELGLFQAVGYPGQWIAEPKGGIGTVHSHDLVDRTSIPFDRSMIHAEDDVGQRVFSAIGQAEVLITPLQAANLMVTILNHGQVHRPRLIQSINYANGVNYKRFEVMRHQAVRSIPIEAYDLLLKALREAVQFGTARAISQNIKLAGKTGTAQFGEKKATGSFHAHHWFVGYYPYDHPKYVIAVVVEDQIAQISSQALPIVEQILQEIESLNAKK